MVRSQLLDLAIVEASMFTLERRLAEEAAEALSRGLRWGLVVHVGLVVFEEEVFFFGESVWFEGDFESVGWFWRFLDGGVFGFVGGGEQ